MVEVTIGKKYEKSFRLSIQNTDEKGKKKQMCKAFCVTRKYNK